MLSLLPFPTPWQASAQILAPYSHGAASLPHGTLPIPPPIPPLLCSAPPDVLPKSLLSQTCPSQPTEAFSEVVAF
jgi:hypothetical protein